MSPPGINLDTNPFIVIWEVTQACSLACRHCRASAIPRRHPLELTTKESRRLIDDIAEAAPVLFVLTGGDPMRRPDLEDLIRHATGRGLRVALSPSATPELAEADFSGLQRAGLARMSLSLDGACQDSHDAFRGVPGTWNWTMESILKAEAVGIPIQINTTFTRQNLSEFDDFVELLTDLNPALWSVFLLVPTGRGQAGDLLSGEEVEELFVRLCHLSTEVDFDIKTTEGHHYRRILLQHGQRPNGARAPLGINDGKGFAFISHVGEIYPSGFLPLPAGNVRRDHFLDVYRDSPLFRQLRTPSLLQGKCGRCEYRSVCGGSRARAYAMSGNYMAEEPLCIYQPGSQR